MDEVWERANDIFTKAFREEGMKKIERYISIPLKNDDEELNKMRSILLNYFGENYKTECGWMIQDKGSTLNMFIDCLNGIIDKVGLLDETGFKTVEEIKCG